MNFKISPSQMDRLLDELCVELGFCLPPRMRARLQRDPKPDTLTMTEVLLRAKGIDPQATETEPTFRAVRELVASHYRAAEDAQFNQTPNPGQPFASPRRPARRAH